MSTRYTRTALFVATAIAAFAVLPSPAMRAQSILGFPLQASSFHQVAPRGFGDRNNSWAQAMIWWHDNLYVGTSRQSTCTSLYGIYTYEAVPILGKQLADIYLPYPPLDPDLSCPVDGADLALQAEIWRWSPIDSTWTRVFQSPLALDNPGPGGNVPPPVGKKLPYDIAIRDITTHTEPDGTEALYALGVNSTILWDRSKLPPPRILRSTDGINWAPLPQDPGTFLGDLPFNPDHSSFRSAVSFQDKIFALCGPVFGQGTLIASANPAQGNNAWFQAAPSSLQFYDLAVYNGWLYIGGFDPVGGYAVYKTLAQGTPPYQLITVVPAGAYLTVPFPSASVVSMHVYSGRLYVGTATFTEVIRINPDDTWDLVVGSPRVARLPNGGSVLKYPLSNLDAGFGHSLNDHAWQMDDPYGYLYVGTYNATSGSRLDPVNGPLLLHNMGAHLYQTGDGWYFTPITTNGFASTDPISNDAYTHPIDPLGGPLDYGIRTMASTPYGMFLGTANDYFGLAIFRATKRPSPAVNPPGRLEIEQGRSGGALLSWQASFGASSYQVWRAEINPISIRTNLSTDNVNNIFGTPLPDFYVSTYSLIGVTENVFFLDAQVQSGKRYMYYIAGLNQNGLTSDPSNLTTFPSLAPPETFAQLLSQINVLDQRQRFIAADIHGAAIRSQIAASQASAAACQIDSAIGQFNPQDLARTALYPESVDVEIEISKLVRRLQLFEQYPREVISDEFCVAPIQ